MTEWTYENVKRGYANLWAKAELRPEKKALALGVAKKLLKAKSRYQLVAAKIGCPWWFVAVAHNLEGGSDFGTYLGNGQSLRQVTTIKPKGRGPFATFEAGAIDALKLKGLDQIKSWEIPRCLYEWERFNGFGYVGKGINSPYVWSFTNLYTKGKYYEDGKYSPTLVSQQCGAAAVLLALIDLGEVEDEVGEEKVMAEVHASLLPFEAVAPVLVRVLAGPAASLAVRVLADVLEEVTGVETKAKPEDVKKGIDDLSTTKLVPVLQRAEETLQELLPPTPVQPQVRAEDPVIAEPVIPAAPAAPTPVAGPVVVQPVMPEPSWLDLIIPAGWKTMLGIAVYVAGSVALSLGYITPGMGEAIATAGVGLAGVGVIAKVDRWLPLFAGFLRVKRIP